jgi:hypothetical protein
MNKRTDTRNIEYRISNFIFRNSLVEIRYSILVLRHKLPSVFCILYSVFCILPGCTQQNTHPEMATSKLSQSVNKTEMMEITEDILVRMHFEIEKYDTETGYIKTRPLEGAQFFEFWRNDNIGAQNWFLGNLHSVRRTVEINIDPVASFGPSPRLASSDAGAGEAKRRGIDCTVHIQRLSMPEQEVSSSTRAYAMFSRSSPALQTLRINPEQQRDMAWIDLGRDKELENEIIKRIQTKISTSELK